MADVLLRDSLDKMRSQLRAGQLAEAYRLGRHILRYYPKHIETYTVFAQVCLANNDLSGANDLLRRVLSADPENVIALAGMALVSEVQEKSSDALWYLERAYEIQPSNDELRAELLRVREIYYGTTPSRVELTPGALARVYARQGQYAQSINEFRRLLRTEPQRFDARVGLVESLYRAGRTDEAAQIALQVMTDAPYALKPNLILGALWSENAVPEGEQFIKRANQLDPEHRTARSLLGPQYDGAESPALPDFDETLTVTEPMPAVASVENTTESDAARAALLLTEIVRAHEAELAYEEPLHADIQALRQQELEKQPTGRAASTYVEPTAAEDISVQSPATTSTAANATNTGKAAVTAGAAAVAGAGLAAVAGQQQDKESATTASDASLQDIASAVSANQAPATPAASPTRNLEGVPTGALAAAAAALATSIALDKNNQPQPTRRTHSAIPKVRPVIPGAAEKLPPWLFLGATPANPPASFDAPEPSTAEQVVPLTSADERPSWLVEAEHASTTTQDAGQDEAHLPDWLKVTAVTAAATAAVSSAQESQPESTVAEPTIAAASTKPDSIAPTDSNDHLPDWLRGESPAATAMGAAALEALAADSAKKITESEPLAEPLWEQTQAPEPSSVITPVLEPNESDLQAEQTDTPQETPVPSIAATSEAIVESTVPPTVASAVAETPTQETAHVEPPPAPAAEPAAERPVSQAQLDSAAMLQAARDKRDAGDIKGALEIYERVMHRRPNYLEQVTGDLQGIVAAGNAPTSANRLLGEAFAMVGRFKESLEQYRIAMSK